MKTTTQDEQIITIKIRNFEQQATAKLNSATPEVTSQWLIKYGLNYNLQAVPRLLHLEAAVNIIYKHENLAKELFSNQTLVCSLLQNCKQIYDLSFVIDHHLKALKISQIESKNVLNYLQKRFGELLDRSSDVQAVFYVQSLNLYISMRQAFPKQTPPHFINPIFQRQRLQCAKVYKLVIKPLFEKKNLKPFYSKLINLVHWLIIMETNQVQLAHDLSRKFNSFLLYYKHSDSVEMINTCNILFDLLSVKFPRESGLSHQNIAALLSKLDISLGNFFDYWLEARNNFIDTIDFEHLLRTLTNLGASSLALQLIIRLWQGLKSKRKYDILLRLFSGYIRQSFLRIWIKSNDDLARYFKIIKVFMIGLCNRQRFEGEEIDQLTYNVCELVLNRGFTLSTAYRSIIEVYSVYQNRFSCLSETSKRFLTEIMQLSQLKIEVADIHNLYDELVIREMGFEQQNDWQQRKVSTRYRGLQNLGNTCYINSFVQALYMTKKFRGLIQSLTEDCQLPSNKNKIYALQFLFEELTRKQFEQLDPLKPQYFRSQLPEPFRTSPMQQDSGQFGRVFLQQLSKELQGSNLQRLQRLLVQKLTKTIRCLKCKNQKKKEQGVFDLILSPQRGENSICLSRLLQLYFQSQMFTNQDKLQCDRCNARSDAISELTPLKLSDILVLTLSLFQYRGQGLKILLPLTFEFTLNLGIILNLPQLGDYELYAFIVHMGSQSNSGHYICWARNLQQNPMMWYCFDDGYVTQREISKPDDFGFGQNQSPYILFYSKKNLLASRTLRL